MFQAFRCPGQRILSSRSSLALSGAFSRFPLHGCVPLPACVTTRSLRPDASLIPPE